MAAQPSRKQVFTWLHLSDLHLRDDDRIHYQDAMSGINLAIVDLSKATDPWHAVLFSGDQVFGGKSTEFEELSLWYKDLLDLLDPAVASLPLVAIPGNHDVERPSVDPANPNDLIAGMLRVAIGLDGSARAAYMAQFWTDPNHALRGVVQSAFRNYSNWWQNSLETALAYGTMRQGLLGRVE